jgi:NADH-quinone oxidoreductase subunit L
MAWFIDRGEDRLVARTSTALANFTATVIESRVIDGAVNGVANLTRWSGERLRRVQSGYVRNYALGLVAGLVVLVAYVLVRAGS